MSQLLYTVITGDIIRSSKLSNTELARLPEVFASIVLQIDKICKQPEGTTRFSIFRGDSFQLLTSPAGALKACILIKAGLRKSYPKTIADAVSARMAIALGIVSHLANNVTESTGHAFTLSGHLLDTIPYNRHTIFGFDHGVVDRELNTALSLADEITGKWTTSQASLVSHLLSNLTQNEIAAITRSSQPTIRQKIKAMGWTGISNLLIRYDEIIQNIAP